MKWNLLDHQKTRHTSYEIRSQMCYLVVAGCLLMADALGENEEKCPISDGEIVPHWKLLNPCIFANISKIENKLEE